MTLWAHPEQPVQSLEELAEDNETELISKFTHPYGLNYVKIEAVSLVTGLDGTGEDPPATPQRAAMLAEMKRRQVERPAEVLSSPDTALVLVRGFLRPGIREGDRFDVEVRVPTRSEATSLRGGWLLETQLTELAVLGAQIRRGRVLGVAHGPVLIDPTATVEENTPYATCGRILGGGVAAKSRPLGILIDDRFKSVRLAQQIAKAINTRFNVQVNGRKVGVATPKTDEFIELTVHDRYRDNVGRYMRVVQNIATNETTREQQERLTLLASQILNPITAASAALQLEALGDAQALELLKKGLEAEEREVRFYAAEALAYLDETAAVDTLAQVAVDEPALRVHALAALSTMQDLNAFEALRGMLSSTSAETRYGAFRSLTAMNPQEPLLAGEMLGQAFSFHHLPVEGPPMIHLTNSHRPEIVLFGAEHPIKLPLLIEASEQMLINGMQGDQLVVSRFTGGDQSEQRTIAPRVEELIRTIVELGGQYPEVVQALHQADQQGALPSRLAVDALPEAGREFPRKEASDSAKEKPEQGPFDLATPLPDLFRRRS